MVQATEWQIPVFVTDFDVGAALDHVSHREIIKATLAMGAPPVLTASRVREYKKSETLVKLDDIVTPGIRRAWSVPQGDPCAADLFGAALDTPAANFCDMCQHTKMDCLWETGYLGLLLFADNCWIIAMSPGELRGARRHKTAWLQASSLCRTH